MSYEITKEDELDFERTERKANEMLLKYYDLKKSDANYPKNPYLLNPDRLYLSSYQNLTKSSVKLNIGYTETFNCYVATGIRMSFNQFIFGTLICEGVEKIKEVPFNKKGKITFPFFSKSKVLNLPVLSKCNVLIKCKNIKVIDIDIYVKNDDESFMPFDEHIKSLKEYFTNNPNHFKS